MPCSRLAPRLSMIAALAYATSITAPHLGELVALALLIATGAHVAIRRHLAAQMIAAARVGAPIPPPARHAPC